MVWVFLTCGSSALHSVSGGSGSGELIRSDAGLNVLPYRQERFAPDLFAAISRVGKRRSVKDGLELNRWALDVVGALTDVQVLCQS